MMSGAPTKASGLKRNELNYTDLLTQIKARLDRETAAGLLSFIGYEVNRNYQFKLRPDERTASASIGKNGKLKDFGTGWSGDIIDLLQQYHGQTFKEAVTWVADCLGVHRV